MTVGTVSGVVKQKNGRRARVVRRDVEAVVRRQVQGSQVGASCRVLLLDLQPSELNLLGLRIQVSRITINAPASCRATCCAACSVCSIKIGPGDLTDLLDRLGPGDLGSLLDLINRLGGLQGGGVQNLLNLLNVLRGLGGLPALP